MIDLLVIGTGGMTPLPGRWLSSFLARCNGELTLFDCGEGTQIPWRLYGWGFRHLGAICLSHWHADHVAGLPGLLHTVANSGRVEPLAIYGPEGTSRVVQGLREIAPDLPYEVTVTELFDGDAFTLPGGMSGRVIAGDHRVPVVLYRIDLRRDRRFLPEMARELGVPTSEWQALQRGKSVMVGERTISSDLVLGPERAGIAFGYMTDTRPVASAAEFYRGVDLLVSEGTYGSTEDLHKAIANKHMTFAEAAAIAREARATALWLTHFSSAMKEPAEHLPEAYARFPNTTLAASGLTMTLRFPAEE